jgi:hypothetical protein
VLRRRAALVVADVEVDDVQRRVAERAAETAAGAAEVGVPQVGGDVGR